MNTKRLLLLTTALLFFSASDSQAQCTVTATATPMTLPCGGGTVDLTANGSGGTLLVLDNDFDQGNAGPGWTVSPAGQFNNPCGAPPGGTGTYMWMGTSTAAPRTLQSAGLDVSCGGDICFDLKFAIQGQAAPCEGPDLTTEGVYLQYSIDGGVTFTDIFYFQPNTTTNAYTTWGNYCFPIPAVAQTGSTIFKWYQGGSSGTGYDHWGIDNVTISSQSCISYYYDWTHIPGSPDNQNQNTVPVTTDTTFTVLYTNGTSDTCQASVTVTINGMGAPAVATTDETCLAYNDGTITVTGQGGVGPYTYDLLVGPSAPQSNGTGVFTNIIPGTYDVLVTDVGSGCTYTETGIIVLQGVVCCTVPINYTEIASNLFCNGDNSGQILLNASGGVGGVFSYSIDNGATMQPGSSFSGLAAGTYDIYITDTAGCLGTGQVVITEPTPLAMTFSTFDATCNLSCDGNAIVIPAGGTPNYTFSWDGGAPTTNATYNNLCAGSNYTLTITDGNGCTLDTNNFVVNEPPPFTITTSSVNSNCNLPDGTAQVDNVTGGAGGYTYLWDVNAGNQTSMQATNLTPGNYDVTVTDANGCITTTTVTVGNNPGNVAQLVNTVDVTCNGGSDGTAEVTSTGGMGPYTYQWDAAANNQTTAIASNLPPGQYTCTITDASGCSDQITVTVGEPTQVMVTASLDTTICENGTANISATPSGGQGMGWTYLWDDPNASTTGSISVTPGNTTVYNVIAYDANGCPSAPDAVVVNLLPPLSVTALTDQSICPGDQASISALAQGGNGGPYNYSWDNGLGNGQLQNVSPLNQTSYIVTATDNCESTPITDTVTISMNPVPQVQFSAGPVYGCSPVIPTFTNDTDPNLVGTNVIWDFGDGNFGSGIMTDSHVYDTPGCYDVTLTVTSPDGCVGTYTEPQMVCVIATPIPAFEFGPQPTTILNTNIHFNNGSVGADAYFWDFGGLDSSTVTNPEFTFPSEDPGSYEVCLTAISYAGCDSTICHTVIIEGEHVIYVPNAFTPDGDLINDVFFAQGKALNSQDYHMMIFDRWGNLVFESFAPETYWDGTYKGQPAVQDVYTWKIDTKDPYTNERKSYNGHVTLLR